MPVDELRAEFEPLGICWNGLDGDGQSLTEDWDQTRGREEWLLGEIERATAWLRLCKQIAGPNRKITSYGLKHEAERWAKENGMHGNAGGYVSNGALLMAAHRLGFTITPCQVPRSPNAYLNISQKRPMLMKASWIAARSRPISRSSASSRSFIAPNFCTMPRPIIIFVEFGSRKH